MLVNNCLVIKLRSSVFVGEDEVVTSRLDCSCCCCGLEGTVAKRDACCI